MNWIEKIIPTIGLLIGIVFVAIGSILAGGSALKLALYEPNPASSYTYQCEFVNTASPTEPPQRLSEDERALCLTTAQSDDALRYRNDKKNVIIDGSMFLVVGGMFWFIFKRWRKAQ